MLDPAAVAAAARLLDDALLERRAVERLTLQHPDLDLADAYRIQAAGIALRVDRGERVVGYKMGLTSEAKRVQMNLDAPIYGVLTEPMAIDDGGTFAVGSGIHPRVEPEIAFLVGRELRGTVSFDEALDACTAVCAAVEILDSRFVGFRYFSLPDVVADNCSSSRFVLSGHALPPRAVDLAALAMRLTCDGEVVQQARSDAISGHPVASLVQLCQMLADHGASLPAGSIVLAGAATVAVPMEPGRRYGLEVEGLGTVSVRAV